MQSEVIAALGGAFIGSFGQFLSRLFDRCLKGREQKRLWENSFLRASLCIISNINTACAVINGYKVNEQILSLDPSHKELVLKKMQEFAMKLGDPYSSLNFPEAGMSSAYWDAIRSIHECNVSVATVRSDAMGDCKTAENLYDVFRIAIFDHIIALWVLHIQGHERILPDIVSDNKLIQVFLDIEVVGLNPSNCLRIWMSNESNYRKRLTECHLAILESSRSTT